MIGNRIGNIFCYNQARLVSWNSSNLTYDSLDCRICRMTMTMTMTMLMLMMMMMMMMMILHVFRQMLVDKSISLA